MTEQEWLGCADPTPMLDFLRVGAAERKLRLFAAACCRRVWHRLADEPSRRAVLVAERHADGHAGPDELQAAHGTARGPARSAAETSHGYALWVAKGAAWGAATEVREAGAAEPAAQAALLRDLLGNPFRQARIAPGLRTPGVVALARDVYDRRAFERMPELAGLLAAAGCADAAVLGHCRPGGEHARGCWLVDALLGRQGLLTEAEWQASPDPESLLAHLRGWAGDRKLRLFACACLRRAWPLLPDEASRNAVAVAERFADGTAGERDLAAAREAARGGVDDAALEGGPEAALRSASGAACAHAWAGHGNVGGPPAAVPAQLFHSWMGDAGGADTSDWDAAHTAERRAQAALLRCVANPFRPAALHPAWLAWRGGTVVSLARAAHDERELPSGHLDPVRLAVLADALQDAGCDDADVLGHLRGPGPHVRGCWPVDAVRSVD
jgi:hypothetical protein